MNNRRWFDSHQPQTLQGATILLYLNCVWLLLGLLRGGLALIGIALLFGQFFGALGIANDSRRGYRLAVVVSVLVLAWTVFLLAYLHGFLGLGVINLIFQIALVAMVLHPQSREYQRIWFK